MRPLYKNLLRFFIIAGMAGLMVPVSMGQEPTDVGSTPATIEEPALDAELAQPDPGITEPALTEPGLDAGGSPAMLEDAPTMLEASPSMTETPAAMPVSESVYTPTFRFKQTWSITPSTQYTKMGGYNLPGVVEDSQDYKLINRYTGELKLNTSSNWYHYYRYSIYFSQTQDADKYSEAYGFNVHEAYVNYRNGRNTIRGGFQVIKLGKVNFDGVLDVLNKTEGGTGDIFNSSSEKQPVPAFTWQWQGDVQSVTLYLAPFKLESVGTAFTRYRDQYTAEEENGKGEDQTFLQAQGGLRYGISLDSLDIAFGFFHWADPQNDARFSFSTDPQANVSSSFSSGSLVDNFTEITRETNFGFMELDAAMGSFVLKGEIIYFDEKNFNHLYTNGTATEMMSVPVTHMATSWGLEGKFGNLFIMPVVSYRYLSHVPENMHLLFYENEATPLGYWRDLDKIQENLVVMYEFGETLKTVLVGFAAQPVAQMGGSNAWIWNPDKGPSTWTFNATAVMVEEQLMTGETMGANQASIAYAYEF
ncbi:MAG: hypothetical protein HQM12_10835 [SAR324 cluster bacterium]|nr:hypothetical protein [SAR324 cluster bacterium]